MARISLTSGYSVIPEGNHVFCIKNVNYDETFGRLEIEMVTKNGQMHKERFSLLGADDQPNPGAMNAFSFFAKTAMNDFMLSDIDPAELVGKYICCQVLHTVQPNKNDPSKTITFVKLGDKSPADGFDSKAEKKDVNLDDIL